MNHSMDKEGMAPHAQGVFINHGGTPAEDASDKILPKQTSEPLTSPVQSYLKDMGNILLLTRGQEVSLAMQMERGDRIILNALIRTPYFVKEFAVIQKEILEKVFKTAPWLAEKDFLHSLKNQPRPEARKKIEEKKKKKADK